MLARQTLTRSSPHISPLLPLSQCANDTHFIRQRSDYERSQRKYLHSSLRPLPPPPPTPFVPNVETFLKLIGRQLSQHASKIPNWSALFRLTSTQLRDLGVEPPRSRKYLLRWRDKFRRGDWGIAGDATYVRPDGAVEVRLLEVDKGEELEQRVRRAKFGRLYDPSRVEGMRGTSTATVTLGPGKTRVVVNVPSRQPLEAEAEVTSEASEPSPTESLESATDLYGTEKANINDASRHIAPLTPDDLAACAPILGVRYTPSHGLEGPYIEHVKGTQGRVAIIKPHEGMWEARRGRKIDGGERRQAHVRAKRRVEERKETRG